MMARELSGRAYPQIGVSEAHHSISHHSNDPDKIASYAAINALSRQPVRLLRRQAQGDPDGDGTLLDHTTLLFGCGMSDGNGHTPRNLPVVVLGGATRGRTVPELSGRTVNREPALDAARQAGDADRKPRRQQRQARSAVDLNVRITRIERAGDAEGRPRLNQRRNYSGVSGLAIVRHMCATGLLSLPRPSFGCLKWRPMMSMNGSIDTTAFGSKA